MRTGGNNIRMPSKSTLRSSQPASPSLTAHNGEESTFFIFALLLALRVANALVIHTFFQPDEYFQALEPAWRIAHGPNSLAWITWEWKNELRSSLHPLVFAIVYRVTNLAARWLRLEPAASSYLFLTTPKATQAAFAACIDFFTWKCARSTYGTKSVAAWATLALSVMSPWQFFCSGRTFSNSLETTLTAAALSFWLRIRADNLEEEKKQRNRKPRKPEAGLSQKAISQLRAALSLAAFAAILRPTNVLIWIPLGLELLWRSSIKNKTQIILEALKSGFLAICVSLLADHWYYGTWTFPPLKFLYFNVAQDLAVFYGRNRWDYYLTEGLPLLLTTAFPFTIWGMYEAAASRVTSSMTQANKKRIADSQSLMVAVIFTIGCLGAISHKEVRFLYPLLPALHVITAWPSSRFFLRSTAFRNLFLVILLTFNIVFAGYVTQVHQRGVIDVIHHIRNQHELRRSEQLLGPKSSVAFLMPCHSTPWRSHLMHVGIDAWALTCEPPLEIPLEERASYLDEADKFYADPKEWMRRHMGDPVSLESNSASGQRRWPEQVVFFEQLLPDIEDHLKGSLYKECWRGFNTHWHDDWRRKGDVIIWCR